MTETTTATTHPEHRAAPLVLDWQEPLCLICGTEVTRTSDGYRCDQDKARWDVPREVMEDRDWPDDGEWVDPDEPQCASTGRPKGYDHAEPVRCLRGENHIDNPSKGVSNHRGPRITWGTNPWVEEIEPPAPKDERDARTAARRAAKALLCRVAADLSEALGHRIDAPSRQSPPGVWFIGVNDIRIPGWPDGSRLPGLYCTQVDLPAGPAGWYWSHPGYPPLLAPDGNPIGPDADADDVLAAVQAIVEAIAEAHEEAGR